MDGFRCDASKRATVNVKLESRVVIAWSNMRPEIRFILVWLGVFALAYCLRIFIFLEHGLLTEIGDKVLHHDVTGRWGISADDVTAFLVGLAIIFVFVVEEFGRKLPRWATSAALILFLLSTVFFPLELC